MTNKILIIALIAVLIPIVVLIVSDNNARIQSEKQLKTNNIQDMCEALKNLVVVDGNAKISTGGQCPF